MIQKPASSAANTRPAIAKECFAGIPKSGDAALPTFDQMNDPTPNGQSKPSRRVARIVLFVVGIPLLIAGLLAAVWWAGITKQRHQRTEWKNLTLERLAELSFTNGLVQRELAELKAGPTPNVDLGWTHDHVLLMTNDEYIVFEFRHGHNTGTVDHLFLGHCSDGRWLYSTYHFCGQMVMVRGDDPPGSVTEFETKYAAREFDGKSDECLKHTWP